MASPNFAPALKTVIPADKQTALDDAQTHHNAKVTVYCDGSGYEGGIGASAVLYVNSVEKKHLRYHLGSAEEHTVYEAELIGLLLALYMLSKLTRKLKSYVVIGSDSQAAIRALSNQKPHPAHHIIDQIHEATEKLQESQHKIQKPSEHAELKRIGKPTKRNTINLQIHWTPGHVDFQPNERADEVAKSAAQGNSSPRTRLPPLLRKKPIPQSIPAIRQAHLKTLRQTWSKRWMMSPRYRHTHRIDKSLPSNKYLKLVEDLDRRQSAIITQLRTGHVPLNQHLFRIFRSETPVCPHCRALTPETVKHYLLQCPHYQHERHILRRKLKRKADSLPFLLSDSTATQPLLRFVNATKRFDTPMPTPTQRN
jgi:ribonuclease HI